MNTLFKLIIFMAAAMASFASYAIDCSSLGDWQKSQIYYKGDNATFEGSAYRAKWWTRGANPVINIQTQRYPVWADLGNCNASPPPPPPGGGTACKTLDTWQKKQIYTKGNKVKFQGSIYRAKWWTRGANPVINIETQKNPVWVKVGTCNGTPPPPPPPPPSAGCHKIDAWDRNTTYAVGNKASYEGMIYKAKKGSKGENPKSNAEDTTAHWKQTWVLHGSCHNSEPPTASIGATDIRPTRNNANSIISIIKDDGFLKTTKLWCGYMAQNGLTGKLTEALITDKATRKKQWQQWRDLYATGCLDIANHSKSHANLITTANLEAEVNGAKAILDRELPDAGKTILYIVPYAKVNSTVRNKIKEQHYSLKGGYKFRGFNTLDPSEAGWFKLKQQQTKNKDKWGPETTFKDMKGWIDKTIKERFFFVLSTHSCGDNASGSIPCSEWRKFFKYLASYKPSDYWFEGTGLVTKYIRERQTASISPRVVNASKITVSLTDTLPNDIFNYPLLLRTTVPSDWGQVGVKQGTGATVTVNAVVENGVTVLYYEAIPDSGKIVLTRF